MFGYVDPLGYVIASMKPTETDTPDLSTSGIICSGLLQRN